MVPPPLERVCVVQHRLLATTGIGDIGQRLQLQLAGTATPACRQARIQPVIAILQQVGIQPVGAEFAAAQVIDVETIHACGNHCIQGEDFSLGQMDSAAQAAPEHAVTFIPDQWEGTCLGAFTGIGAVLDAGTDANAPAVGGGPAFGQQVGTAGLRQGE